MSRTVLIWGDEAHSGSYHGSYGLTHACFTHRHRRHALPLHTRSSTTPPKHSPAQNGQGPPLGDPGRPWLATALGSSAAVSGSPTTAHRRQALTPVWWTCCGHGRCAHAAWSRPQLRCRPAWTWRPTSGVVSGRRLNESVEQRVTSVPLESLPGRNPGAGPWNTPRSRLSRIAGHSRAARSELATDAQKGLHRGRRAKIFVERVYMYCPRRTVPQQQPQCQ